MTCFEFHRNFEIFNRYRNYIAGNGFAEQCDTGSNFLRLQHIAPHTATQKTSQRQNGTSHPLLLTTPKRGETWRGLSPPPQILSREAQADNRNNLSNVKVVAVQLFSYSVVVRATFACLVWSMLPASQISPTNTRYVVRRLRAWSRYAVRLHGSA